MIAIPSLVISSLYLSAGVAAELYYKEHIQALVGPACDPALETVARLAAFWNIPIVTGAWWRPSVFTLIYHQHCLHDSVVCFVSCLPGNLVSCLPGSRMSCLPDSRVSCLPTAYEVGLCLPVSLVSCLRTPYEVASHLPVSLV